MMSLNDIVQQTYDFGLYLDLPPHVLEALQVNFPTDVNRRKREVVKAWMSSSRTPPCWWHLVDALRRVDRRRMAEKIEEKYGNYVVTLQLNMNALKYVYLIHYVCRYSCPTTADTAQ